jgi:hypothetical protein
MSNATCRYRNDGPGGWFVRSDHTNEATVIAIAPIRPKETTSLADESVVRPKPTTAANSAAARKSRPT